jgi:hypothetical protein
MAKTERSYALAMHKVVNSTLDTEVREGPAPPFPVLHLGSKAETV